MRSAQDAIYSVLRIRLLDGLLTGMTGGTLAGIIIADQILGKDNPFSEVWIQLVVSLCFTTAVMALHSMALLVADSIQLHSPSLLAREA